MEHISGILSANLDVVYFIYGLAFALMGLAILLQPKKNSGFAIAPSLWLLGGFGLTHGANELLDMWQLIGGWKSVVFDSLKYSFLLVSYLFLFEFGRRLVRPAAESGARFKKNHPVHLIMAAAAGDNRFDNHTRHAFLRFPKDGANPVKVLFGIYRRHIGRSGAFAVCPAYEGDAPPNRSRKVVCAGRDRFSRLRDTRRPVCAARRFLPGESA